MSTGIKTDPAPYLIVKTSLWLVSHHRSGKAFLSVQMYSQLFHHPGHHLVLQDVREDLRVEASGSVTFGD